MYFCEGTFTNEISHHERGGSAVSEIFCQRGGGGEGGGRGGEGKGIALICS